MTQTPTTFVLVHGAWAGGWIWRDVAQLLRAQGHSVYTPTLTGLGERSHLVSPDINLTTHVLDVVNLIKFEELSDVVLVGHSYGGMVISGVAERVPPGTIRSIVFLDAFYPEDGQALVDLTPNSPPRLVTQDPIPRPDFGPSDAPRDERLDQLVTPQPRATFLEPLHLTGARERIPIKTYVLATGYELGPFRAFSERLKSDATWRHEEIACGHATQVERPQETAEVLLRATA